MEPDVAYVMSMVVYMIAFLHSLNFWWGWIITKVVFRAVFKGVAEDTHSKVE
jgi:hypothetical protein